MSVYPSNRPELSDLRTMPIGEIATLPAEHLAALQSDAEAQLDDARMIREWVSSAIAQKYGERARAVRQAADKDTGTVRFEDGPVTVIANLPKKVDWDQKALGDVVARIQANGDDPADYVETQFQVSERKYAAWPASIRAVFEPARTVRPGKPKIDLCRNGDKP